MNAAGIDFGTTNSAVAVYRSATDEVMTSEYEPTVLFFEEDPEAGCYIGKEAIRRYVAAGLKGRFIRSIKSVLHLETFKFTYINGKKYYAEDLVALILSHLAQKAERMLGCKPDKVVLGRPARFSSKAKGDELAQSRLLKAAKKAGFSDIRFQLEPIAAAYSYESKISQNELVFVGDFGGGTSDFTLMQLGAALTRSDRNGDIVGSTGVRVGGDDFDAEMAWGKVVQHLGYGLSYDSTGKGKLLPIPPHHYRKFCRWENHFLLNTPQTLIEVNNYFRWTQHNEKLGNFLEIIQNNWGYALFRSIEKAKIALSSQRESQISFERGGIHLQEVVTLDEFGLFVQRQMDKLRETIEELLGQARLNPKEVDSVFLTGGSSLVLPVRQVISDIFGADRIKDEDAFTSVARGLALTSKFDG